MLGRGCPAGTVSLMMLTLSAMTLGSRSCHLFLNSLRGLHLGLLVSICRLNYKVVHLLSDWDTTCPYLQGGWWPWSETVCLPIDSFASEWRLLRCKSVSFLGRAILLMWCIQIGRWCIWRNAATYEKCCWCTYHSSLTYNLHRGLRGIVNLLLFFLHLCLILVSISSRCNSCE